MVPFDRVAYHCGKSTWKGYTRLNACSVGVELVNPGYWRPGMPLDGWDTIHVSHPHERVLRDWYLYTDAQYDTVRRIHALFPTAELVGHDEIAPTRKLDPGPAWDWSRVR
jgi:N-acetylmuramoyl-L-alanine amidase